MGQYITQCVVFAGKKKYPPQTIISMDDDAALPHIKSGALVIVVESLNDPSLKGAQLVDGNGNALSSDDTQERVAQALTEYNAAQAAVDAAAKKVASAQAALGRTKNPEPMARAQEKLDAEVAAHSAAQEALAEAEQNLNAAREAQA